MTDKEKAKAYDEALERVKKMFSDKEIKYLFPELAESEDERIRNWIINDINYNMSNEPLNNSEYRKKAKKAIAWLEKQGEQKSAWSEEDEKMFRSLHNLIYVVPDCDCDSKEKKELSDFLDSLKNTLQPNLQQEWSEEDEKCIKLITDIINSALRAGFCVQLDRDRCVDWFKSLKEKLQGG